MISLDDDQSEIRYSSEPADTMTPELAFERQWATVLLQQVLDALEAEFVANGNQKIFDELKIFLTGENSGTPYSQIADRLQMSEGTLKVTVHRLRQRYRELLRLEIGRTVTSSEEIDEELQRLFEALR